MITAAAAAGGLVALGVLLLAAGARRVERAPRPRGTNRLVAAWQQLPPARQAWVVASLLAGVVTAALTGFVLAIVLLPAVTLGIPYLLSAPPSREVELLAGLDRWVRLLSTTIGTGKSIRDAIFVTRAQSPQVLRPAIDRMCARLDQRWSTRDALLRFADDLDSADADAVAAALAIASSRGGVGTQGTLSGLSDTIQDRLRALREVATERAKPRTVVKQVTTITLLVLGAAVVFNGRFFEAYRTPLGQLIALALAAAYAGCLVVLRRKTIPPPAPRFLRG